jgi:hypothetical protein
MKNINKAIEALKIAEEYLDREANDPKKYNTPLAHYLEILSWEVSDLASRAEENNYLYG